MDAGLTSFISRLCCEMEVDGLRADLAINKTARALAAWHGRTQVTLEDIRTAAELVLPHRRRRKPFERPGLDEQRLDELFNQQVPETVPSSNGSFDQKPIDEDEKNGTDGTGSNVLPPASPYALGRIEVFPPANITAPERGRRNGVSEQLSGHYVRALANRKSGDVAVDATVRAAAGRGCAQGKLDIQPVDIHRKQREGKTGTLTLFAVDASGSMAARRRMEAVKGAVLSLLRDAYEQRDQVGVVAFRGIAAEVLLKPTRSVDLAEQALRELPTGGRTPLAHGLCLAQELLTNARQGHSGLPVLLVVLSDGKANVPMPEIKGDPWGQSLEAAARLRDAGIASLVLDSEAGFVRLGRAKQLAQALNAEYLPLDQLSARDLVLKIRQMI